jgi:hypothetical protein
MISLGWISALPVIVPAVLLVTSPLLARLVRSRKPLAKTLLRALVLSFIGMFLGLMVATAGGAIYPPTWKVGVRWVCDGTANFESHAYSYKPGQSGVTRNVDCVNPADGSREDITGSLVVASTLIYGGALSLLLLLFGPPWRRRDKPDGIRADTTSGRPDIDARVEQLRRRLHTGRSSTVDHDVATDVSRLLQSIAGSSLQSAAPAADEHDIRHIFSRIATDRHGVIGKPESIDEQLRHLKHLFDQHLITEAEYTDKKADLLAGL